VYSEKARELIRELPNRGALADATHKSRAENPICGDITHLYLKLNQDVVVDARFETYGCPAAIAASAAVVQMCRNRPLQECREITAASILVYLGGLPSHKLHAADLAADALKRALRSTES
jgi:nitrogen fixation NifU-like protein